MKFLLNMNLPRELGTLLKSKGHEWRHAGDVSLGDAKDSVIVQQARASGEVIVTHDLDYGHLLAFSGENSPSVIIFRVRNTRVEHLFSRLTLAWSEIERPLAEGAIIAMEDATLRIRRLPIDRDDPV